MEDKIYRWSIIETILYDICLYGLIMGLTFYGVFYVWYEKTLNISWMIPSPLICIMTCIVVRLLVRYSIISVQHWCTKNNMAVDHTLECTEITLREFIKIIVNANDNAASIAVCDEYIRYAPDGHLNRSDSRVIYLFYSTGTLMVFDRLVKMCKYFCDRDVYVNTNDVVAKKRSAYLQYTIDNLTKSTSNTNEEEV